MRRFVLAALGALLFAASPASAAQITTTTLTFAFQGAITDDFSTIFGGIAGSPSAPAFTIYGGPDIASGSAVVGLVSTSAFRTDAYFFLGVTGDSRLVLGVNRSLAGESFANLFPSYEEASLIAAVTGLNAGTAPSFGSAYQLVSGFQAEYGSQYAFSLEGTGYLTAFSPGSDFGIISTSQTSETLPGAVPEIATWIMMIAGIGMIGALARRRPSLFATKHPLATMHGPAAT